MGIRDTALLASRAVLGGYLAAIAGTMVVASATHRASGPFAANRGYELPATNLAAALALAVAGPGRYSLDGLTGLRLHRVLVGTVVAGAVAGAAVNVAMLLRATPAPPAPASPEPTAEAGTAGANTR